MFSSLEHFPESEKAEEDTKRIMVSVSDRRRLILAPTYGTVMYAETKLLVFHGLKV